MLLIAIVFFALLILGAPVAFAIGISGFTFFLTSDVMPVAIGVQKIATVSQSFPLLAVPFFVLAGHLMNESGITERLFKFSHVAVAWMAGGLAQVSIILSTLMGGVSGSAVADAAMEARILGPQMIGAGYSKGYASSVIALSSLITSTIPPSIGLILYGYVGQVSIGRLFMAGIIPGVLMMIFLMVAAWLVAKRRNYVVADSVKPTWGELGRAAWQAKFALLFPVLLIFSIRGGIFTPSEVGAFAVVYAIIVGFFLHGDLTVARMKTAFTDAITDIGLIMLIILMSGMIGFAIIFLQAPQSIASALLSTLSDPRAIVAVILISLFIAGLFFESTILVLLLTPIFVPVIEKAGVDPVHFGILMMTIVTLGSMTPPVGVAMYTVCGILKTPLEDYIRESLPFFLAIFVLLLLLLFVPQLTLFLPNLMFG
ncbi:TRAP transporter large permease [Thioclava sp. BHET1]|uniref:TRAP transporter large permease protein n=1 Tax=Thioclava dalianensis TaxID=1185766 RepID=A0A074TAY3_9RHOB|nr:TRAP transporter large permease [Thioclava dalianensis]KEP68951.1 C4-dicarboxylate ABC transporter [Thioclava dalianensis]TMV91862.1 TRAP transporter large permease [Thioclava sp. BHET1]SFN73955.1 TRAP transporter, DctM subunit [Thioclava dalianensis]